MSPEYTNDTEEFSVFTLSPLVEEKQTRCRPVANRNADEVDGFNNFLKSIGKVPLLTPEDEIKKAKILTASMNAPDSGHKEAEIRAARNEIVEANFGLVLFVAKKYPVNKLSLEDRFQEGVFGLIRAIEKFDPKKGFRLSTYAVPWIEQAIDRAIADKDNAIRVPAHLGEQAISFSLAKRKLFQELGRNPTEEELVNAQGITKKTVIKFNRLETLQPCSLDAPINSENGDLCLGDAIRDPEALTEDIAVAATYRENTLEAFNHANLCPRDNYILTLRFGLTDDQPRSLEEIGEKLGITRERVRQLETKALMNLRSSSAFRELQFAI